MEENPSRTTEPGPSDELERQLRRCEQRFSETKNPLYAWEAWGVIGSSRRSTLEETLDIPDWLTGYFDDCQARLLGWQPERVNVSANVIGRLRESSPPSQAEGPGAIGKALGFERGLRASREGWGGQFDARESLALWMADTMFNDGLSVDAAARLAENERRASRSSAIRALKSARLFALDRMRTRLCLGDDETSNEAVVSRYIDFCRDRASRTS